MCTFLYWAVGSLVVRVSDFRPEGQGSMPPNTFRVHTEHVLAKSVGPNILWAVAAETPSVLDWRIFTSPLVLNCGGGDQWCRHLS
ncbi:hypothetical protein TNCV_4696131 [Trichonephila clavipes]|nr:hypothetical protein TNCV_4696131 [Trichonephila clavipes]